MENVKDEAFLKKLGNRIKEIRNSQALSLLDLSVRMDNHPEQLYRIENGKQNATICSLKKIADALGVTLEELFRF